MVTTEIYILNVPFKKYSLLMKTVFESSPTEFLATQTYSPQSSLVMLYNVSTAFEVRLPWWWLMTFPPLYHVTLRRDSPLATQLRVTSAPSVRRGGLVMFMILGKSATAIEIPRKQEKRKRVIISIINFFQPTDFMMFPPVHQSSTCVVDLRLSLTGKSSTGGPYKLQQFISTVYWIEMYGKIKKGSYYHNIDQNKRIFA